MNSNRWIRSLIKSHPDLYRAIYDWNAYPHRWAEAAWLEEVAMPEPLIALLEQSTRGRLRLSRYFRQALGVEEMLWDLEEPRRRLALLSARALERLARFAGAAAHAARLAHIVTKEDRRAVVDRLGEAAYGFALRRGRSIALPSLVTLDLPAPSDGGVAELAEHTGWRMLAACVSDDPPALQRRLHLKIPRPTALVVAAHRGLSSVDAWNFLQPLLRDVFTPEDLRCFA